MNPRRPFARTRLAAAAWPALLAWPLAAGADQAPAPDPDLPQAVTEAHFGALMGSSPFLRTLNLAETYALRGIAEIDGERVATLYNRETKQSLLVSAAAASEEQMRLVGVQEAGALDGVSATIAVAGEEVELKFEPERVAPPSAGRSRSASSGGGERGEGEGERRRGPSREDMERYNTLPDEKKEKFREYMRQTMVKYPDLSREERGNMIRGALTRLAEGGDITLDPNVPASPQGSGPPGSSGRGGGSSSSDRSGGDSGGDRSRGDSGGDRSRERR